MKRNLFVFILAALPFLFPPHLRGEVVDRIIALVNNQVITLSELEQMGKPILDKARQAPTPAEREENLKKARREVLGYLIESKLLEEEMKRKKIEVPERDVDAAIGDVLKASGFTENELKKTLLREGLTYAAYRQKVRDELGKMRLVSREIKSKIVIEEERLRDYYQKNLEKFTDPLEVKIQQIFLPVPEGSSGDRWEAVRKEALAVLIRARKGEDFSELAKHYSRGPEAQEGGILGYFKHRELMPELEEAGFPLRPGEISDLVRSPAGFHILRVLERKGGEARPFAEVQFKIREELSEAEAQKKFDQWMKELKARAYIEIRL